MHPVLSCHVMSCTVLCCTVLSFPSALSCHVPSCYVLCCTVLLCSLLSCSVISCLVLSCCFLLSCFLRKWMQIVMLTRKKSINIANKKPIEFFGILEIQEVSWQKYFVIFSSLLISRMFLIMHSNFIYHFMNLNYLIMILLSD